MRKRRESLEELYELCDNSSYNYSSYAEFTVLIAGNANLSDLSSLPVSHHATIYMIVLSLFLIGLKYGSNLSA